MTWIIDPMFTHPEDPTLVFPFVKNEIPPPEETIQELFNEFNLGLQDYDSVNNIMYRDYDKYWKLDSISCNFTEEIRVLCVSNKKPTIVQVWKSMSPIEIRKYKSIYDLRTALLYGKNRAGECNFFNPALCLRLYLGVVNTSRKTGLKILDPSAGWGDRMIAAIAAGDFISEYVGYDINHALIKPYDEIIRRLDHSKKCKYFIEPFEKAIIPFEYYDLGVTSPPYYDLEIYTEHPGMDYYSWIKVFYEPYLLNWASGIKKGGHLIIYVSNYTSEGKRYDLEDQTIKILQKVSRYIKKGEYKTKKEDDTWNKKSNPGRPFFCFEKK